jgi:hypothetical protein
VRGSRAMRADAMESVTCGWLSLAVGLIVEALTGAWWVDAAPLPGIVEFLVKEGREAGASPGASTLRRNTSAHPSREMSSAWDRFAIHSG